MKRLFLSAAVLFIALTAQESFAASILLQDTTVGFGVPAVSTLANFYTGQGLTTTTISDASILNAASLTGIDLFVGYVPGAGYTASEFTALSGFLSGGGRILFVGENGAARAFTTSNNAINGAITTLGGTMQSDNLLYDAGFYDATVGNGQIIPNFLTVGVNTLNYAAPSGIVSGGTLLFLTIDLTTPFAAYQSVGAGSIVLLTDSNLLNNLGGANDNGRFFLNVAQAQVTNVPEPSTLVLLSGGLSVLAIVRRQRQKGRQES